jgi:hypothetical protein
VHGVQQGEKIFCDVSDVRFMRIRGLRGFQLQNLFRDSEPTIAALPAGTQSSLQKNLSRLTVEMHRTRPANQFPTWKGGRRGRGCSQAKHACIRSRSNTSMLLFQATLHCRDPVCSAMTKVGDDHCAEHNGTLRSFEEGPGDLGEFDDLEDANIVRVRG